MEVVILSGGFDPLHEGHIAMFDHAKKAYDHVVVGLNSDDWLRRKKGRAFMSISARSSIVSSLRQVDDIIIFDDTDDSACDLIRQVMERFPNDSITFGNGGDRTGGNFPELAFCIDNHINTNDELGGGFKQNSSSDLLAEWKYNPTKRDWGLWKVLSDYKTVKIKELIVNPLSELSWQVHERRSEFWFVRQGTATIYFSADSEGKDIYKTIRNPNSTFHIGINKWHQLVNETEELLSIIEIQYGSECSESDILRGGRPSGDYLLSP